MFIELWTDDFPVTFDGLVVEAFTRTGNRWHVTQIVEIKIEEGKKGVQLLSISAAPNGGFSLAILPPTSVPVVAKLVAEINRVRHERFGLGLIRSSLG